MGIHYQSKELVEINTGEGYVELMESFNLHQRLIVNTQLPKYLQLGGHNIGINKRQTNAAMIASKLLELIISYGENIEIEEVFNQLKTFVNKVTKTGSKWEPASRYNFDDCLDAVTYAYIARMCYPYLVPLGPDESENRHVVKRFQYDKNWNLTLSDRINQEKDEKHQRMKIFCRYRKNV